MAKHDDFYSLMLAEMPGCPLVMVKSALTRSALDFCRLSMAWQEDLDPIQVKAGVAQYELDLPSGALLVVVTEARIGSVALATVSKPEADRWRDEGQPFAYSMPSHTVMELYPQPHEDGTDPLVVQVALSPTLDATTLPDILAERYFEAVAEGAKAILKRMPNQPWTDIQGAVFAQQISAVRTAEARIEREFGRVRGDMAVTPRAFGA